MPPISKIHLPYSWEIKNAYEPDDTKKNMDLDTGF
jgi:hypothetical protein